MPRYGLLNYVFGHFEKKHELKPRKKQKAKPTKVFDHTGKLMCIIYPDGKKEWFNRRY